MEAHGSEEYGERSDTCRFSRTQSLCMVKRRPDGKFRGTKELWGRHLNKEKRSIFL